MDNNRLIDLLYQQKTRENNPVERLTFLPHPYGMLKSEGRGSVMSKGIDWGNWIAPSAYASLVSALTAPANSLYGKEMNESDALNVGLNTLGAALVAGRAPVNSLGMNAINKTPTSTKYMIYDGSHRLEAAKLRGDKTITAKNPDGKGNIEIPIKNVEHGESAMPGGQMTWPGAREKIREYASRPSKLPPIEVIPLE